MFVPSNAFIMNWNQSKFKSWCGHKVHFRCLVIAGRNSTDLGWGSNLPVSKSTWSTHNSASPADDMWGKSATRPPPGFNKNINRSMSMPHGPSEKSAFSPGMQTIIFSNYGSVWCNKLAAVLVWPYELHSLANSIVQRYKFQNRISFKYVVRFYVNGF